MSYQRKEVIGGCTLYLADSRALLPSLSADVVLTDPVWPNAPECEIAGSEDAWALFGEVMDAAPEVRRCVVVMRCDSDPRFLSAVPEDMRFLRTIQLGYSVPGWLGRVLGGQEIAYWFGEAPKYTQGRKVVPGIGPIAQPGQRAHPMARAQVHFDWLAWWVSDAGETVLDPYMGSGTSGVACVRHGRPFIGVEIDEGWFDLACERIAGAYSQPDMLVESSA